MQKDLYKKTFEQVCVSDAKSDEILGALQNTNKNSKARKKNNALKWVAPLAAVMALSFITVSAAGYLNKGKIFEDTFNLLYPQKVALTEKEKDFFEINAGVINQSFSKDGVTIRFDSVVADSSSIYLPYTIDLADGYNNSTLGAFIMPNFYLGEIKGHITTGFARRLGTMKVSDAEVLSTNQMKGAFRLDTAGIRPEKLTMVIEVNREHFDTGINLKDAYQNCIDKNNIVFELNHYSLRNCGLNIPLKNTKYEGFLQSVAYGDGKLVLGVQADSSRIYPVFMLKNKITEKTVSCVDDYYSNVEQIYVSSFKIDINDIDKYNVVVRCEQWYEIPLPIKDTSQELDIGDGLSVANVTINRVVLSNLSVQIYGKDAGSINSEGISLKLKNGDLIKTSTWSGSFNDDTFMLSQDFRTPISKEDMQSIIITVGQETLEIPIK